MKTTVTTVHRDNLDIFVNQFLDSIRPSVDAATVIALEGDLGAGKTTFVTALARALGCGDSVVSPTFVIMKLYAITHPQFSALVHIDAYRLEGAPDLEKLRFREYCSNPENIICIEWPSIVAESIPQSAIKIAITTIDESTREFSVTLPYE